MHTHNDLNYYENELYEQGYKAIAGTDEVGRGPMAGPLVAAAVILPKDYQLEGLNDSKQVTPKMREKLYDIIMRDAIEVTVEFIEPEEIDKINVYQASKKAMISCIKKMKTPVDYILTDAMKLNIGIPCLDLIKGDTLSASIAAASIIAKVTRDRYMEKMDEVYPVYGFKKHKGYVTKEHLANLAKYGPCPIHRQSYEPVRNCQMMQTKLDI